MEEDILLSGSLTCNTNLITSHIISSVVIEKDKVFINGIETIDARLIGKEILKQVALYRDEQQFINAFSEL